MFDDDDPVLARLRSVALDLPGADMKVSHGRPAAALKVSHGRPAFWTEPRGKVFAYYGGSQKVDGSWVAHDCSVMVQPDPGDRPALLEDPRVWIPAYLGGAGWLGIDLDPDPVAVDWVEVGELLDASYRLTAPARLVRELAGRAPG